MTISCFSEFVAALENPMMFASRALEQMTMGTKENEEDEVRRNKRERVWNKEKGDIVLMKDISLLNFVTWVTYVII